MGVNSHMMKAGRGTDISDYVWSLLIAPAKNG